jgi:hypothetical protein
MEGFTMFVSEVYRDAQQAFAGCDEAAIFRRLTEAIKLLNNQGILDYNLGEMEICSCNGCLTLPRDVGTVLGVDICGNPTLLQDQWFAYHINGPGANACGPCGVITEMGQVCTFKDPSQPAYLLAEVSSAADNNKKLRVFATEASTGRKIFTPGPDGKLYEGFLVPTIFGFAQRNPNVPPLGTIYRVSKETTKDFVKLYAVNSSDGVSQTLIGDYEPDETLPQYRRIRVPNKAATLVKYKKADLEIRSQRDFINCDNRQALLLACRSVKFSSTDKYDQARAAEAEAVRLITAEAEAKRPAGPRIPQIINGVYRDDGDELFYSSHGCSGPGAGGNW